MPRLLFLLIASAALAGAMSGCATPRLADERIVEPYASLLRAGDAHGTRVESVNAAAEGAKPLRMQVTQMPRTHRGTGPLLILQSGILADGSSWRFMAPELARDYDLLLIDPPGCGGSDKPRLHESAKDAYSPAWLGQHTLRAVQRWEEANALAPRPLVFIGHSLGGAALTMALGDWKTRSEFSDLVARTRKIVLLQPADIGMLHTNEHFKTLAKLPDPVVHVGSALGVTNHVIKGAIHNSVVNPRVRAHRQEAESFHEVIRSDDTRHAAQAMLVRFRKTDADGNPDWLHVQEREARYGSIAEPVLIIWGDQGTVLEPQTPRRLQKKLLDARVRHVPDAKHSPHQEKPLLCARWISEFIEADPEND